MRPRQAASAARSASRWKQVTFVLLAVGLALCVGAPTGTWAASAGAALLLAACLMIVGGLVRWIGQAGRS